MLLIILLVIAGLVLFYGIGIGFMEDDVPGALLGLLAGGVIGACVFFIPFQIIGINPHTEIDNVPPYKLVALNTGNDVSGSFFLGSGYIDSYPTYNYIIQGDGYVYRDMWYDEGDAKVFLDDETPSVNYIDRCNTNRWLTPWDLCWYQRVEFHVPPGSVQENYTVAP